MAARKCEVCRHEWNPKEGYIWIVLCPKCKVSGYHIAALRERERPEVCPSCQSLDNKPYTDGEDASLWTVHDSVEG